MPKVDITDQTKRLDKSTTAGKREYLARTYAMAARQGMKCALCPASFHRYIPSFDHARPRGMGGAHTDDRIVDEQGNWLNAALCLYCNATKGSKHYAWIGNRYQEITKTGEAR